MSSVRLNSWPQNCGKLGKHIEPSTPLAFMSRDALVDVVAARPHLGERRRLDAVLLGRLAGHGVEPDVRELLALVEPDVVAAVGLDDLRRQVLVLGGQVAVEHVGRLDHVVVDRHQDHVLDLHRETPCRDAWASADHDVAVTLQIEI